MPSIRRLAVIGAGTMGHGIAQVAAMAGHRVTLFDVDFVAAETGLQRIRKNLDKGVQLGKVSDATRETTLAALRTSTELADAVVEADLVIEAAPESMELKRSIFADVEARVDPEAILASNTSSLSIATLASGLRHPSRLLGLHFFNPVHLMTLVEVVHGPQTAPEVLEAAVKFVERLDREPIVVKDSPGFASSRLGVVLGLEAMRMVEEGVASPQDIDRAMELGYRHPMGPLKLTDLVGLDVRLGIARYLYETLGSEAFRPPEILERMVAEGHTGKKSGRGFYDWGEG
ncbi:MAG: 3-hydroxyacyl-CoA dehydrogenase family protein [Gemmatimonadetes bacterium]|nr:3-hydroxyacyl-CoA dehydrogenase family protein [Gemmatimonadota bacterium]NNF38559.1 3-hydroxyacyl-CoA dehydrogenase family protein [Gemmatimonadota bacterium]